MNWFKDYVRKTDDRRLSKWLHYFLVYERELERFRNKPVSFLEIGVWKGGSIPMWKSYFAEGSRLTFIDIDAECAQLAEPGTTVEIGNQSDSSFMKHIAEKYGPFDIIIDDGSHINLHQIQSFSYLWPCMKEFGLYIVEDTHTSYWPGFGGGYRNEASFIEYSKRLIDTMHSWYTDQDWIFPFNNLAHELFGVRYYDSIVVFEKCSKKEPPSMLSSQNGKIETTQRPLEIRGRVSAFSGRDGS